MAESYFATVECELLRRYRFHNRTRRTTAYDLEIDSAMTPYLPRDTEFDNGLSSPQPVYTMCLDDASIRHLKLVAEHGEHVGEGYSCPSSVDVVPPMDYIPTRFVLYYIGVSRSIQNQP